MRIKHYGPWSLTTYRRVMKDQPEAIAVDTETTGVGFHDTPFAATMSWRSPTGELRSGYFDLDVGYVPEILWATLANVPTWVFWNAKFDLQKLDYIGALPNWRGYNIEDGQPLAALLDENRRMALKVRAVEDLGHVDTVEVEIKSGPNKGQMKRVAKEAHHLAAIRRKLKLRKDDGYHLLPRAVLIPYAITDTELTLQWWEKHRPLLPPDLEPVYAEEIKLIHTLRQMEANGVGVDVPYLEEVTDEYGAEVMRKLIQLIELTGVPDFNPASVQQVQAAFKVNGVTLDSTDKVAMRELLGRDNLPRPARLLAETLHEYREAAKIHSTYLTSLSEEQRDGVWHPWFNAVGPRTGRMSSSKAAA